MKSGANAAVVLPALTTRCLLLCDIWGEVGGKNKKKLIAGKWGHFFFFFLVSHSEQLPNRDGKSAFKKEDEGERQEKAVFVVGQL